MGGTRATAMQSIQVHLSGSAISWMKKLPAGSVASWETYEDLFVRNFRSTCKKPASIEQLMTYKKELDESMRTCIQRWSIIKNLAEHVSDEREIDTLVASIRRGDLDIKSAFLNGDLMEEAYVQQHPGFIEHAKDGKVLHLKKALYGLRQALSAWNTKLDISLTQLGFVRCPSKHAVYTRGGRADRLLLGVYVDDLIITETSTTSIVWFKKEMMSIFKMSDLGFLSYYLGIEVIQ
jgi:hypothetical protein